MAQKCNPKPFVYVKTPPSPPFKPGGPNRVSELISWKLLKKNPSGLLIWGIFGAALVMDGFFYKHFLLNKEYQVDRKKRMWNERIEMIENPVRMKLYYPSDESVPVPNQPLIDIYHKMKEADDDRLKRIADCIRESSKFGHEKDEN